MDLIVIVALFINFVGVLFAVFNNRIKIERRLTRIETLMSMMARNCDRCQDSTMRSGAPDDLKKMEHAPHAT